MDFNNIPFVQAQWYHPADRGPADVQAIVLHDMEAPDKGDTAEKIAQYFASGSGGRQASAHYCIDSDSIVQCVQCKDIAYGAKGFNHNAIHLEHAGYASQSYAVWTDPYNVQMFGLSAELCAKVLMPKFGIPAQWLSDEDLRAISGGDRSIKGFCTHADITRALGIVGGHTDPGPNFPRDKYMEAVQANS